MKYDTHYVQCTILFVCNEPGYKTMRHKPCHKLYVCCVCIKPLLCLHCCRNYSSKLNQKLVRGHLRINCSTMNWSNKIVKLFAKFSADSLTTSFSLTPNLEIFLNLCFLWNNYKTGRRNMSRFDNNLKITYFSSFYKDKIVVFVAVADMLQCGDEVMSVQSKLHCT